MQLEVTPGAGPIGARVSGLSLAETPTADVIEAIEGALERHGVLVFPGQPISDDQLVAFWDLCCDV